MVKFKAQTGDRIILGFGLTETNVKKLREGQPIIFGLEQMGMPGIDVLICYGETEENLMTELQEFIGADTQVKNLPKIN